MKHSRLNGVYFMTFVNLQPDSKSCDTEDSFPFSNMCFLLHMVACLTFPLCALCLSCPLCVWFKAFVDYLSAVMRQLWLMGAGLISF